MVINTQHLGVRDQVEGNFREQRQRERKRARFPRESGRTFVSPRKNAAVSGWTSEFRMN